ncbi:MAG: DUF1553 domain-containing protein, partial [Planctomycetales bacterium]|nr:DUF1553 domain-containing protein [Planctomycetales bacterium]
LLLFCTTCIAGDELSFNQDIRPILSDHCFACHGPDAEHREADLRLDQRQAAIDYGAIVPMEPDDSLLTERIFSDDPDIVMPPAKGGKQLTEDQKQTLRNWISQGAEYQKHWSFEPISHSIPIPASASKWSRNNIDRFIEQKHGVKGLAPAPEVDRSTWLRRVTFDLTGLPPTIDELDAFLGDESANAYERVVDRLLESETYGERMANMWLDVARYADTFGYQNDVAMEVWPWRDWVINAFNRNMPYDQFVTEQIAGDLLPGATQDQRLATTFNRLHRQTNEGGSVAEEFRLTGIADRTTTAGTAFLGLTLECCRCHDHKFDPIAQRDFYRLSAYFSDIDELGLYSHFTFSQPTPAMLLYQGEQREQHDQAKAAVQQALQRYQSALEQAKDQWMLKSEQTAGPLPSVRESIVHLTLDGDSDGVMGKATQFNGDDEVICKGAPEFGRTSPFSFSLWVNPQIQQARMMVLHQSVAAEDSGFRGLQLTIDDGHPQFSMIHFWPGNAVRVNGRPQIPVGRWSHLAVTHDGSGTAAGLRIFINGKQVAVDVTRDGLTRDIRHRKEWSDMKAGDVQLALGARFRDVGFRNGLMDDLHVFDVQLSKAEIASLYQKAQAAGQTTGDAASDFSDVSAEMWLDHHLLTVDDSLSEARALLQKARDDENELVTGIRQIMVMEHSNHAESTHLLGRGEYTDKREKVSPGVPQFLSVGAVNGGGRSQLAKWMTDPENPLTARVIANRMWHLFFGRGIVVTLEDFGSQGTPPSHPELLDYLARSLMDDSWDLKALCRSIVLSATYRQSSSGAAAYQRDPQNVWLARGPKHRLSAEQLRDAALYTSRLLVHQIGGPSVMPYQPAGLWKEAGTGKTYNQSTGDGLYRRSLYTFWKRTAPPPSMLTFDATNRESCTPRRELTKTPLQALVFLNDPQYVEASRVLAEQLVTRHGNSLEKRWLDLFRILVSRPPTEKEIQIINLTYAEQLEYFRDNPDNATELLQVGERQCDAALDALDTAATSIVVQTILAYDECIMLR